MIYFVIRKNVDQTYDIIGIYTTKGRAIKIAFDLVDNKEDDNIKYYFCYYEHLNELDESGIDIIAYVLQDKYIIYEG